jgi:hypothetical protein
MTKKSQQREVDPKLGCDYEQLASVFGMQALLENSAGRNPVLNPGRQTIAVNCLKIDPVYQV